MNALRQGQTAGYTSGVLRPSALLPMHLLYTLALGVALVAYLPVMAWRSLRRGAPMADLRQRLGRLPVWFNLDAEPSIWIHAVSVGEALTARALTSSLRERYPALRIFLSTTTATGQEVARRDIPGLDGVFFMPIDLPFAVRRTLARVKPRLMVMLETEIWPNLLRACQRSGVRTMLLNARISNRSYPRYRMVRPLFRQVLAGIDRLCAQSAENARRLIDLGADPSRVMVTGSLKYDSLPGPAAPAHEVGAHRVLRFFRTSPGRAVIVAGSTLDGEEVAVFRSFRRVQADRPGALLIIAPRRPERFGEVEQLARDEGFRVIRRSDLAIDVEPRADVVVLDTIGELAQVYQVATVVFVGGSLVEAGGHNILEPALHGRPVVTGPHLQNFREIADTFLAERALVIVRSEAELADALSALVADPDERRRMGEAGRMIVEANRGARERTLEAIAAVLPPPGTARAGGVVRPFRVVH